MNKCTDIGIQEMLPDMLHSALDNDTRKRLEAHLAACESCREELDVLRTVKSAAVFAPSIDVDRVVRQIPPYQPITPVAELPGRRFPLQWLVAAAAAVIVVGGGSVLMSRQMSAPASAVTDSHPGRVGQQTPDAGAPQPAVTAVTGGRTEQPHALVLASDVASLSDVNLVQLMNDMVGFDALPATEPEPVIS